MKFSDRYLQSLKPREARYDALEGDGFGVRVATTGRKTFYLAFQLAGKRYRMDLGDYPETTLSDARAKHVAARAEVKSGINPIEAAREREEAQRLEEEKKREEERIRKEAAEREIKFSDLAELYMEKWAKPRKRSWEEDQRILNVDVLPVWGKRKVKEITRRDVATLLEKIVKRGAPIAANRALALVRKVFNFAIEEGILESLSPCANVRTPSQERRRDRVLTESEIRSFWLGLETAALDAGTRLALRLILMTAQRAGEVVGAAWADIDMVGNWWTIPGEKAKNKMPHRVPVSVEALRLLEDTKQLAGDSPWLFPSPRGAGHMAETSLGHALRRNLKSHHFQLEPFVPHDLRRTAASHMTGSGINRLVVSKILNYAEPGVTAVYDRHSYDREKRTALDSWARRLMEIIQGEQPGKVVPFAMIAKHG